MTEYIYLDHSATCPMRESVVQTYVKTVEDLRHISGNPSALHYGGQASREILEKARADIAAMLAVKPSEVIFTSGGTEADNLAVVSVALKCFETTKNTAVVKDLVLISAIEHPAVLHCEQVLKSAGIQVYKMPVLADGKLDMQMFETVLRDNFDRISVVSIMLVNNETGVIEPVDEVAKLIRSVEAERSGAKTSANASNTQRIFIHTDAIQAFGHIDFSFGQLGVDAMSVSGHKIGAPVGVGLLVAKQDLPMRALYAGGGQERGVRSGTIDVASAVAMAEAVRQSLKTVKDNSEKFEYYKRKIVQNLPEGLQLSTHAETAPHILHLVCQYGGADAMLFVLDKEKIAVSAGSACRAGVAQASYVLEAMGFDNVHSSGGLRISFGYTTTEADIDKLIQVLPQAVEARAMNAVRM